VQTLSCTSATGSEAQLRNGMVDEPLYHSHSQSPFLQVELSKAVIAMSLHSNPWHDAVETGTGGPKHSDIQNPDLLHRPIQTPNRRVRLSSYSVQFDSSSL